MKVKILVVAFALAGCGGPSFTAASGTGGSAEDGGFKAAGGVMVEPSTGGASSGGASSGGAGGAPSSGGTPSSGGSGGSSGSTGGTVDVGGQGSSGAPSSGGSTGVEVCCRFLTGDTTFSCDPANPWACTAGTQALSCKQAGQCTVGLTCYGYGMSGGTVVDAFVTHDNGLQQTWKDCVPLGTYNQAQAMKACKASSATTCSPSTRCGSTVGEIQGWNADGSLLAEWGYEDFAIGIVSLDYNLCSSHDLDHRQWR